MGRQGTPPTSGRTTSRPRRRRRSRWATGARRNQRRKGWNGVISASSTTLCFSGAIPASSEPSAYGRAHVVDSTGAGNGHVVSAQITRHHTGFWRISSGVPSAMTAPASIAYMRSQSPMSNGMSCSTIKMAQSARRGSPPREARRPPPHAGRRPRWARRGATASAGWPPAPPGHKCGGSRWRAARSAHRPRHRPKRFAICRASRSTCRSVTRTHGAATMADTIPTRLRRPSAT